MPTRSEAIKAFLSKMTHQDLAELYSLSMEAQVNVAQDHGEKVDGEFEGVRWHGYSDGLSTWKSFRIPRNASTEPTYFDSNINFNLVKHVEGIGMTGWDWKNKVSKWVAFDFDAIIGHSDKHSKKLTPIELKQVQDVVCKLDWVTVRYSTSGKGLHVYVFVDDVPTANHTEHAALARSILNKMSSLTGFDFASKVDICGGNMWVWHRKMVGTNGLELVKQGTKLYDIPPNWKDHIKVTRGTNKKLSAPTDIEELQDTQEKFDNLTSQRIRIKLDESHLKLIKYLNEKGLYHWWDADHHMLVTHTMHLKQAHKDLSLRGIFETETKGTTTHNCFMYPMRNGAWSVRRYTPGVKEHVSWDQDGAGWTRCYFNNDPTLASASTANGGVEDPSGGYHFSTAEKAEAAANALGANVVIPPMYSQRPTHIKPHKDGNRLVFEFISESHDDASKLPGWLRKGTKWIKIFAAQRLSSAEQDSENYDDIVRHLVTEQGEDGGWSLNVDGKWNEEPLLHIKHAMNSLGLKKVEVDMIVGGSVLKPWTLVCRPFEPEFPGDRVWNRRSPQLRFVPSVGDTLHYPTWMNVLHHVGHSLDEVIHKSDWCRKNGIKTGADYLKVWIASLIQYPTDRLPYLFIYSDKQHTGKSTFHEALELLFHPGYERIDNALREKNTFNGEFANVILGVIEEVDLSKNKEAYDKIKDWVTALKISLHIKHVTPFLITNTMHFIQCANSRSYCPIFPGDTRITMLNVREQPKVIIPKNVLLKQLEKEAPDFLGAITTLEIPESDSRLRVPVIETSDKIAASDGQRDSLQTFIKEKCYNAPGYVVSVKEFYESFLAYLEPSERPFWSSKQKVSNAMPDWVTKGRLSYDSNWHWGNISLEPPQEQRKTLVCVDEYLRSKG